MEHILIAGSRTFNDRETFEKVITEIMGEKAEVTIVEGGAAGADSLARDFANEHNIPFIEFKPDWKKYGRAAGPKRNDAMVAFIEEHSGSALYFWDEESKGTKQCIESARKRGIDIHVWSTRKNMFL